MRAYHHYRVLPLLAGAACLGLGSVAVAQDAAAQHPSPPIFRAGTDVASDISSIGVLSGHDHGAGTVTLNGQVLQAGPQVATPTLRKGERALVHFIAHHAADGSVTITSITPASAAEDAHWRGKDKGAAHGQS